MLRQIEGSRAVADAVALSRPEVICAYPITPQTHIVEALGAKVKADTLRPCKFLNVESEFAAMSVAIGASAAGARAYTATASQGLLYMPEAVYNAAGLGLPIVMTVANRAIGAPINIWNDHSDAMSQRDVAVGHGKKAARCIDAWLRGDGYTRAPKHDMAPFGNLNTWYYADAPATVRPELDAARRTSTFDEVVGGLDASTALFEARRCLSCGNCFECDNCYGVCPDNAVIKLGPGQWYEIDDAYCKGCGICVTECPSGSITMVPEQA